MIGWIIGWIVVGAILGALARAILPGKDPMSIPATIGLGILGQVAAGIAFWALFGVGAGWIAGLVATIGLLMVSRRTGIGRRGTGLARR
jgi:uncharacterized membrane protein YeaQ/YmgE (transglycosylase-associated protein family)